MRNVPEGELNSILKIPTCKSRSSKRIIGLASPCKLFVIRNKQWAHAQGMLLTLELSADIALRMFRTSIFLTLTFFLNSAFEERIH